MQSTLEFLAAAKSRLGIESDYALAKALNVGARRIGNYRTGVSMMDADMCYRIAEVIGLEPGYVLACIEAERAKRTEDRQRWSERAKRYAVVAMLLISIGISTQAWTPERIETEATEKRAEIYIIDHSPTAPPASHAGALWAIALLATLTYALFRPNDPERS